MGKEGQVFTGSGCFSLISYNKARVKHSTMYATAHDLFFLKMKGRGGDLITLVG